VRENIPECARVKCPLKQGFLSIERIGGKIMLGDHFKNGWGILTDNRKLKIMKNLMIAIALAGAALVGCSRDQGTSSDTYNSDRSSATSLPSRSTRAMETTNSVNTDTTTAPSSAPATPPSVNTAAPSVSTDTNSAAAPKTP
jgi:hypothetical protein